ncbi:DNA-binding protein WhiA [Euzebya pacifica]|jgi:hypothetical protein|uniref:DNA-binding protein WhiA n=1 Tax=Euzebya pacifica TaxID=1608957 RepID=UPI0030F4B60B
MSLTVALREELAHIEDVGTARRLAEARAMVDLAGTLRVRGSDTGPNVSVVVRCAVGAVARRLRGTLVDVAGVPPGLARRQGGNLRGGDAYLVDVAGDALHVLGVLDDDGRPVRRRPEDIDPTEGYLAGGLMVAGTLSGVNAPVHLEIRTPDDRRAAELSPLVPASAVVGDRIVVKSGDAVAELLAAVGAHQTFLAFDGGRMRRELRRKVTRAVNADRANLRRATAAAGAHITAIEHLVAVLGWDGLPEDLADVALARVANPEASLTELGELLDPPVGKATVHRRLKRLILLAEDA